MIIASAILFAFAHSAVPAQEPTPGKQVAQSLEVKTKPDGEEKVTLHYWLYLPNAKDMGETEKPPLMLFLHGAGERGDNLEVVKKHGPPKLVAAKPDFPFILISPQCPRNERWQPAQLAQLVDHVAKIQNADTNRLYVTGLSMGGYGTWALAAAYPDKFAAAAPICGGGDTASAEKLKDLPLWVFHGEKDSVVPAQRSKDMVAAIEKAGGKPKLTLYPEAAHDSWTETYNNPDFYTWLLSQRRGAKE
jgi:predicted peptidase